MTDPVHPHSRLPSLDAAAQQVRVKRLIRRLSPPAARYRVRSWILDTPVVSEAFVSADPAMRDLHQVTRRTRLVLEGFPRSANSYARAAFEYSNGLIPLCSHMHSHRAVQRGVAFGIPTVVLIRDPRPVIASSMQYTDGIAAIHGIRAYLRFYEHVLPLVDGVVVADFADVIGDFGAVIELTNRHFGSGFVPYVRTPEAERAVAAEIDGWANTLVAPEQVEKAYARPTSARRSADDVLAALDRRAGRLLADASELYANLLAVTAHQRIDSTPPARP